MWKLVCSLNAGLVLLLSTRHKWDACIKSMVNMESYVHLECRISTVINVEIQVGCSC